MESGMRDSLSEEHPSELLRLTDSLNRLLRSEREQRIRYRDSLDDLAHSLKTPLAVLQGVSENIAKRPEDMEQAWVLQSQIERMSQQIGYQLQRASLRKSGLVRHHVMLRPVVESLCNTLDKVYRDKQVNATLDLPEQCSAYGGGRVAGNARQLAGKRLSVVPERSAGKFQSVRNGRRAVYRRRRPRRSAQPACAHSGTW